MTTWERATDAPDTAWTPKDSAPDTDWRSQHPHPPTLDAGGLSPSTLVGGSMRTFTLRGTGFTADAAVAVSGVGITVGAVDVVSATRIRVTLTADATLVDGSRNVTVVTAAGTSNALGLTTQLAVFVRDTFSGAPAAGLAAHVGELGAVWTVSGSGTPTVRDGELVLATNGTMQAVPSGQPTNPPFVIHNRSTARVRSGIAVPAGQAATMVLWAMRKGGEDGDGDDYGFQLQLRKTADLGSGDFGCVVALVRLQFGVPTDIFVSAPFVLLEEAEVVLELLVQYGNTTNIEVLKDGVSLYADDPGGFSLGGVALRMHDTRAAVGPGLAVLSYVVESAPAT